MKSYTLFEFIFQELRIWKVKNHIPKGGVHVDLGCDTPPVLINRFRHKMKNSIGLDVVAKPHSYDSVQILQQELVKTIALPSNSADVITMLAVLEHLKHPEEIVKECYRVLKKGGVLLVTVPSPANKPVLDVLAKFGVVRKEMIEQHENYFTTTRLEKLGKDVGFSQVHASTFELGLNTFFKAVK